MENASKALLMGAGILIAVLIISVATRLFTSASEVAKTYFDKEEATEISKFNANFSKFTSAGVQDKNGVVTKQYATIYDIITLANFVHNYNSENLENPDDPSTYKDDPVAIQLYLYDPTNSNRIYENLESESYLETKYDMTYNKLLEKYYYIGIQKSGNYYTFEAEISSNTTGRINKVTFKQY